MEPRAGNQIARGNGTVADLHDGSVICISKHEIRCDDTERGSQRQSGMTKQQRRVSREQEALNDTHDIRQQLPGEAAADGIPAPASCHAHGCSCYTVLGASVGAVRCQYSTTHCVRSDSRHYLPRVDMRRQPAATFCPWHSGRYMAPVGDCGSALVIRVPRPHKGG